MPQLFSSPSSKKPNANSTTAWLAGVVFGVVFVAGLAMGRAGTHTPALAFAEPNPPAHALASVKVNAPEAKLKAKPKPMPPRNCTEARNRGIAPMYRGEPEYGEWMDGDHDGIACEPYPKR